MIRLVAALAAALTLAAPAAFAQPTAKPAVAAYARLPAIQQAAIAPDGTRLAYIGGTAEERVTLHHAPRWRRPGDHPGGRQ